MPYKDPEKKRECNRRAQRRRRGRDMGLTPPIIPDDETGAQSGATVGDVRIKTARDLLWLLAEQINLVRKASNEELGVVAGRARCIAYIAQNALRAVEAGMLEDRLRALEQTLKARKTA